MWRVRCLSQFPIADSGKSSPTALITAELGERGESDEVSVLLSA
jgi:hypothetical protein